LGFLRHSYFDSTNIDKTAVYSVLKQCKNLATYGVAQPKSVFSLKKTINKIDTQFVYKPREVSEIIRQKAKEMCEKDMIRMRDIGITQIAEEIEQEYKKQKEAKNNKNNKNLNFMDSVEYDLKNSRNNPDNIEDIINGFKKDRIKAEQSAGYAMDKNGKVVNLRGVCKKFQKGINKCADSMNELETRINSMDYMKSIKEEAKEFLLAALQAGDFYKVQDILKEKPKLLNCRFSVFL